MRVVVITLLAGVLLAGCQGDEPSFVAGDYRPGDCRTVMPAAYAADRAVDEADDDGAAAASTLKSEQDTLRAALPSVTEMPVREAAQELVNAIGFYRIGVDAKNYTPKLGSAVRSAYDELARVCQK